MRGQSHFEEHTKEPGLGIRPRKGRSDRLVARRNECLLARYYYYGYFKNMCYEETIRQLVIEFYLSPNTIAHIVLHNRAYLQSLKQKGVVPYYFQNHWPHMKW